MIEHSVTKSGFVVGTEIVCVERGDCDTAIEHDLEQARARQFFAHIDFEWLSRRRLGRRGVEQVHAHECGNWPGARSGTSTVIVSNFTVESRSRSSTWTRRRTPRPSMDSGTVSETTNLSCDGSGRRFP